MPLPHQAGKIADLIWSRPSQTESQDLKNGYVVGQDNYTGEAIAHDGSSLTKGQTEESPTLGKEVDILRPNSQQKARKTTFKFATTRTVRTPSNNRFTNSNSSSHDVQSCGSNFKPDASAYEFPEPPEQPPEPEDQPLVEETLDDPLNPQVCVDPQPTITRPKPPSDQYFLASSIDEQCPLGMQKAGFVDFGNGEIWIQCKSPTPVIGDGIPVDLDTYGYDCSPCGTCVKKKGGQYPTLEICQQSGCNPVTYTCTSEGCIAVFDGSGNFKSLAECETSCNPVPYSCIDGECVQTLDGKFATLADCQASCGCLRTLIRATILIPSVNYVCISVPHTNVTFVSLQNVSLTTMKASGLPVYRASYFEVEECSQKENESASYSNSATQYKMLYFSSSEGDFYTPFDGLLLGSFTVTIDSLTLTPDC